VNFLIGQKLLFILGQQFSKYESRDCSKMSMYCEFHEKFPLWADFPKNDSWNDLENTIFLN
jgi:hypothetical protein